MDPIVLTVIVAGIIALIFGAVVVKGILNVKQGKHCCSCGGSCTACPANCGYKADNTSK